jgi:quercetin dioxygenase-like cupin family protein
MPRLIESPARVAAAGHPPKQIDEHIGRVRTGDETISIARMKSPQGWIEPGQSPDFDEYTLVLSGMVRVEWHGGVIEARAGQTVVVERGTWIRYSTPEPGGAEYVGICVPAFAPHLAHRDQE